MERKPDAVGLILIVVIVAAAIFVWSYGGGGGQGGIATLRTEEVATQLGFDQAFRTAFQQQRGVIQADLARQRELLQADVDAKREEFGENPTPEQQENLQAMEQQMEMQVKQLARRAQDGMQKMRSEQLQGFRSMLGPVIMKLQEAHGFTVVIDPVMSNVFFYDRSTDITDDVIQELQQQSLPPAENIQAETPTP